MSEKIKVTIVMNNEKQNIKLDGNPEENVTVTHDPSMTLMSTLLKNKLIAGSFCGGRGDCGRCLVQFLQGAPLPTPLERNRLEAEELRQGFRLSCLAKPKEACVIKLVSPRETEIGIITEMMDLSEDIDQNGQYKKSSVKRKLYVMESDTARSLYIIAVDLGTTTIAMQLRDLETGDAVDTYCEMNPQRKYGSDVLSRIQASCEGQREALKQCVWEMLERGVRKFTEVVDQKSIGCICVAGNTTMEHLLMGYDVSSLGKSPFTPAEIGLQKCRGFFGIPLYITPGISAFVGGDVVAGLYALGMLSGAKKGNDAKTYMMGKQEGAFLFIDLGTNGEMVITDGKDMLATAAAAGPAFEGGPEKAAVGTDMIAVTASLMKKGILDETGLLAEPYFTEGAAVQTAKGNFRLKNQDIRALQMAKAAVRAGAEILWEQMGRPRIEKVYLAGGFGYYLDVEAAFAIGLLPGDMRGSVQAVGNTSLEGAFLIGRDLYRQATDKRLLEEGLSSVKSINLAKQEGFESLYLKHMNLGESSTE